MAKKINIGLSPITSTIYAGHLLKDGRTWGTNKQDVTEDAISSVAEYYMRNRESMFSCEYRGKKMVLRALTAEEHNFLIDNFDTVEEGE